jgi:hypothetical protein
MSSSEKCAGKPNPELEVKTRGERYTLVRIKFRVVVGEKTSLAPYFLSLVVFSSRLCISSLVLTKLVLSNPNLGYFMKKFN